MSRLRIGSLCSGYGGLDRAIEQFFDAEVAWFVENDPAPSKVLAYHWPAVPNLGDMTRIDWTQVEPVHIVCGGTPCQDLSGAGKRAGMTEGTRSNLWVQMRECIATLRPTVVIWENVRGAYSACADSAADSDLGRCPRCVDPTSGADHAPNLRALGRVLGDLSDLGFDAEVVPVLASDVGAPHPRFRVFVLAFDPAAIPVNLGYEWERDARGRGTGPAVSDRGTAAPVALLPTPNAMVSNDGESFESWETRRRRVAPTAANGNGMGMPLSIAVQLLPTPVSTDAAGTRNATANRSEGKTAHSGETITDILTLLPTPRTRGDVNTSDRARELYSSSDSMGDVIEALPLLPTPRASRGASSTEIAKALGADISYDGDKQGNAIIRPAFTSTSVEEYEALWEALDDQSPYWVTTEGKDYWPAVERWTRIIGRPAPAPSIPDGKNGRHRLSAKFPEWMMGLPSGWVTGPEIGLTRNAALKAIGNGVVTQQAYRALEIGWSRIVEPLAVAA